MAFDRNKLYFVINENGSPVYFPSRNGGYMIDGARADGPTIRQVHFDDIVLANSTSSLFRDGVLFFEKEAEEEIYNELRITDWQNIWHNSDIERILVSPTMEELKRIVESKSRVLFDRVRGVYIGMRNANMEISQKARTVIEERQKEYERGVVVSKIVLEPKRNDPDIDELKRMIAQLQERVETTAASTAVDVSEVDHAVKPKKTTKKSTAAKSAAKKKSE